MGTSNSGSTIIIQNMLVLRNIVFVFLVLQSENRDLSCLWSSQDKRMSDDKLKMAQQLKEIEKWETKVCD